MRGLRFWSFATLAGCAALGLVGRAAAADDALGSLRIAWSAPAGCPDDGAVRTAIGALISDPAALSTGAADLSFRATVTREGERWILRAESGSLASSQAKTIEAESCGALSEAFALIVAFAVDPVAQANAPVANTPPTPAPETPAAIAAPAAGSGVSISLAPLAAAGVGVLPSAAFGWGAAIAGGIRLGPAESGPRLRIELAGLIWPEQTTMLSGSLNRVGARAKLVELAPAACLSPAHSFASACLGVAVGGMSATGVVATPDSRTSWWLAVTAGGAAEVPISRYFGFRARLDAGLAMVRPSFALERVGPPDPVQVFKPAPAFAVLRLEPEIRFSATDSNQAGH